MSDKKGKNSYIIDSENDSNNDDSNSDSDSDSDGVNGNTCHNITKLYNINTNNINNNNSNNNINLNNIGSAMNIHGSGYLKNADGSVKLEVTLDKDDVQCCVCLGSMTGKIFHCRNKGKIKHNVCQGCEWILRKMKSPQGHTKVTVCPMCKTKGQFKRNYIMETQLKQISKACKNCKLGCEERFFPWDDNIKLHLNQYCMFEPIICPFCKQSINGGRTNFIEHLHKTTLITSSTNNNNSNNNNNHKPTPITPVRTKTDLQKKMQKLLISDKKVNKQFLQETIEMNNKKLMDAENEIKKLHIIINELKSHKTSLVDKLYKYPKPNVKLTPILRNCIFIYSKCLMMWYDDTEHKSTIAKMIHVNKIEYINNNIDNDINIAYKNKWFKLSGVGGSAIFCSKFNDVSKQWIQYIIKAIQIKKEIEQQKKYKNGY